MMFKFIFRAIALLIAIIVAIPAYALFVTWNSANNPSLRTAADVIVIPGAAQLDGTPGPVLQARLEQFDRGDLLGADAPAAPVVAPHLQPL